MIDPAQFRTRVIRPAIRALGLWSAAAEDLLLGTALVESGLTYLVQHGGGPALGVFQIEPATHEDVLENWVRFRPEYDARLDAIAAPAADEDDLRDQLVWNLAYAAAIARLVYYRRPEPLPVRGDVAGYAAYWKRFYNTHLGAGREDKFVRAFERHAAANMHA